MEVTKGGEVVRLNTASLSAAQRSARLDEVCEQVAALRRDLEQIGQQLTTYALALGERVREVEVAAAQQRQATATVLGRLVWLVTGR